MITLRKQHYDFDRLIWERFKQIVIHHDQPNAESTSPLASSGLDQGFYGQMPLPTPLQSGDGCISCTHLEGQIEALLLNWYAK